MAIYHETYFTIDTSYLITKMQCSRWTFFAIYRFGEERFYCATTLFTMKTGNVQWLVNEKSTYQKHKQNHSTHSETFSRALDRLFVFALHYDWLISQIASLFSHLAQIQCSLSVRSSANRNFQFRFEGCTFLELGAGVGLCSIVVGRVAKKVFCTGMQGLKLSRTNLLLEVSLNVFP